MAEPPPDPRHATPPWVELVDEQYCYLTTTGRVTGRPHRIEIWFAIDRDTLYLLSGGEERSDWVRNLRRDPLVTVELGTLTLRGRARSVADPAEDERARTLVYDKYAPSSGDDLSEWRHTSLPIAVDLAGEVGPAGGR